MQRPPSIILFERLFWASLVASFLTTALAWNDIMSQVEREASGNQSATAMGFAAVILAITLLILTALWYGIARRGSNVTKWIYEVLTALGTLSTILAFFEPDGLGGIWLAGTLLSTVLSVASVAVLFRADAIAWLKTKPVDPGTFR